MKTETPEDWEELMRAVRKGRRVIKTFHKKRGRNWIKLAGFGG